MIIKRHIGLVNETRSIEPAELKAAAAAIQKQVHNDFEPVWGAQAKVEAYATLDDIPIGCWPVIIKDNLEREDAAGYHVNDAGDPSAFVKLTPDWTVTASHEVLEIVADPWGRHTVVGPSPRHPDKLVRFLVEVCDPCSDSVYEIDGIKVSDFYLPRFFEVPEVPGTRYSHTGDIKKPLQVLKGGYLTWHDPESKQWWHRAWFDGPKHEDVEIPIPNLVQGNIRSAIDKHVRGRR